MIYFVTFPLIRPNMKGTSDKEGTGPKTAPPVVLLLEVSDQRMCPAQKLKKCNFQTQFACAILVHIFCQHFTENLLWFVSNKKIFAIFMSILPTFPVLMPLSEP